MRWGRKGGFVRFATLAMLVLGIVLLVSSAFYVSSFLAIIGLAIAFWGAILLYIKPVKHVPLSLLYASAEAIASNIERILIELKLSQNGIYLPPKNLKNAEDSIVFVPASQHAVLPTPEENNDKLYCNSKNGVLLTPPGLELCQLFERGLGLPITKTDLSFLQTSLPKLLVETLEVAESLEVKIIGNTIIVEVNGTLFAPLCEQTGKYPRCHGQVGCLLSSALACAFAKSAGEPVTIESELLDVEEGFMQIEFHIGAVVIVSDDDEFPVIFGREVSPVTIQVAPEEVALPPSETPIIVVNEDNIKKKPDTEPPPKIVIDEEHIPKEKEAPVPEVSAVIIAQTSTEEQETEAAPENVIVVAEQPTISVVTLKETDQEPRPEEAPKTEQAAEQPPMVVVVTRTPGDEEPSAPEGAVDSQPPINEPEETPQEPFPAPNDSLKQQGFLQETPEPTREAPPVLPPAPETAPQPPAPVPVTDTPAEEEKEASPSIPVAEPPAAPPVAPEEPAAVAEAELPAPLKPLWNLQSPPLPF